MRLQPLVALAQLLGIDAAALAEYERTDRLLATFRVPAAAIARLTPESLRAFAGEYGTDGVVEVRTRDLPELTVSGDVPERDLDRLLVDAANAASAKYDVVIDIQKAPLRDRLVGHDHGAVAALFFFASALERFLRRGPRALEQRLWTRPDSRLVLVVLDWDAYVVGGCLTLLGGEHVGAAPEEAQRAPARSLGRMAMRRAEYVGWDSSLETSLTPHHVSCPPGDSPLGVIPRLHAMLVGLTILYTCDQARYVERADATPIVQARYRGSEHTPYVPFTWSSDVPPLSPEQVTAVTQVADWVYEPVSDDRTTDAVAERLTFVQTRVAQLLEGRDEHHRFSALPSVAPVVVESMQWHWRAFVERRVGEYLQHVRDLEALVTTSVTRLADQTAALVRRLSETSLAAVAALLASFIAAAFKEPFQADLFRIGMLAYAAYVALFPLLVGVTSTVGDARLALASFAVERRTIDAALGPDRVDELIGQRPSRARRRFRFWVAVAVLAYVLAATAAVVAAFAVPPLIGGAGAAPPATSDPPTPP